MSDSAAVATGSALERYIASEFMPDRGVYKDVHAWWSRHALRAADASALFPDIYFRRLDDSIELSWLGKQPEYAPDGFELVLTPGSALLAIEDVAKPLWGFIRWVLESAPTETPGDAGQVALLKAVYEVAQRAAAVDLETARIASTDLLDRMRKVERDLHWLPRRKMLAEVPVVAELDSPALMFGGLNISLEEPDLRTLYALMIQQRTGQESSKLASLVSSTPVHEYMKPFAHGYDLAYQARRSFGIELELAFVDVEKMLEDLSIAVSDSDLETQSIRGVAIAGSEFAPAILINGSSRFNASQGGRRFTLAHELCHILFDRSSARRISHISGPWASAQVEKRANAFAAMFLATPHALSKALIGTVDRRRIGNLSRRFGMGFQAMLEHLRNLDLISDQEFWGLADRHHH